MVRGGGIRIKCSFHFKKDRLCDILPHWSDASKYAKAVCSGIWQWRDMVYSRAQNMKNSKAGIPVSRFRMCLECLAVRVMRPLRHLRHVGASCP